MKSILLVLVILGGSLGKIFTSGLVWFSIPVNNDISNNFVKVPKRIQRAMQTQALMN